MIKLYDTRRRQKVDFEPVEPGKVSMYVCGPTVYNRIHIGNARTFISFDMIRRYLTWRGFDVTFVQNVTDVDDKIIKRAGEEARTAAEVAEEYTRLFIEDMRAAGVQDPDIRPKATEEIGTMIALIERLIERGHALRVGGRRVLRRALLSGLRPALGSRCGRGGKRPSRAARRWPGLGRAQAR